LPKRRTRKRPSIPPAPAPVPAQPRIRRSTIALSVVLVLIGLGLVAWWWSNVDEGGIHVASPRDASAASREASSRTTSDAAVSLSPAAKASYVGSAACGQCHASNDDAWHWPQAALPT
jgi:hypothetical protein